MTAARARKAGSSAKRDRVAEKLSEYLAGAETVPGKGVGVPRGVLVDTCAWIDYLRSGKTPIARALEGLLRGEQLFTCGQVMFELLQGVRSDGDREAVTRALGSLEYLELHPRVWIRAAGLASALRCKGRQLPQSDLLIAALALEHKVLVLTADKHFEEIPGLGLFRVT